MTRPYVGQIKTLLEILKRFVVQENLSQGGSDDPPL